MSHHPEMPKTTVSQFLLAVVGALVPVLLVFTLITNHILHYAATHAQHSDAASEEAIIAERIKPVGEATVGAASAAQGGRSGEEVVKSVCIACHGVGALGSPKIGDKAAWGPRIAQGYATLIKHAISGLRAMPPRGGASDLSDDEVAGAIAYMANQAGANFKAPEPKQAPAATAAPAAGAATAGDKGKATFDSTCSACHATGAAGSPKAGDKSAWGPRIAQGKETLYKHALGGFQGKSGTMPAKGGNAGLADADVKAAVDYMVGLAK